MNKVELPADMLLSDTPLRSRTRVDASGSQKGIVGTLFGEGYEKPGNVAGVVILVAFVAIAVCLLWYPDGGSISKKDVVSALSQMIMLALGYLFGRGSVRSSD